MESLAYYDGVIEDKKPIKIKKENAGKFTDYCKSLGFGGVTNECISKGKKSTPNRKKQAIFAENARGWSKKKKER